MGGGGRGRRIDIDSIRRAQATRRAEVSDARRYPAGEVSDARRYQTRGEADRVQGRTWEGGKGEEDR